MIQDEGDSTALWLRPGPGDIERGGRPQIVQLESSFQAFGLLIDHLSRVAPFSRYDLGNFARALRQQLRHGHHLAAMRGPVLVGYVGWLLTSREIAEKWLQSGDVLRPVERSAANAAALTVVSAQERGVLLRLIRGARTMNPAIRVYFKRQYAEPGRGARKSSVANVGRGAAE
jgi:hypothetical protein